MSVGSGPARSQQAVVVGSMYVGYAAFMVLRTVPTTIATALQKDLGIGVDVWGRVLAIGTCGGIAGKFVGGFLADRLGGKITFTVGLLLTSVSVAVFALGGHWLYFAATFFFALMAKSAGWPSMAKIITNWFRADEYGSVWGIISTSSRVGTIIASLALGAMLAFTSWRVVLLVGAGIGVVCTLLFWFILKEAPDIAEGSLPGVAPVPPESAFETGNPYEVAEVPESSKMSEPGEHPLDGKPLSAAVGYFFLSPQFWLITASLMGLTVLWDFLSFLPNFLQASFDFSDEQAAMAPAAFPFGSLISVLFGGFVFDKLSRRRMAVVMGLLLLIATVCMGAFYGMTFMELTPSRALPLCIGLLFVFGVCVSPCYYIPMSVFSIEFGGPHSGFLISFLDVFGFAASATFSFVGGSIAAKLGWDTFMIVLVVISVWSLVSTVLFMLGEAKKQTAAAR